MSKNNLMRPLEFVKWACERHDVFCNQKYDKTLPYSFHLDAVGNTVKKYWPNFAHGITKDTSRLIMVAYGHDLIEDARVSYNDILGMTDIHVAEAIFALTENKGRNRSERHGKEYYTLIAQNELAHKVKLADIMSNIKYSMLMNSPMLDKYIGEWPFVSKWLMGGSNDNDRIVSDINKLLSI